MRAIAYRVAALAVAIACAGPAVAQQSVYTSLDLAACYQRPSIRMIR